jgi:hypothetical protein
MEGRRIKIKYHQGYDPLRAEKLSAAAIELCGEFNDYALEDGAREMSFQFENDENLRRFFQILKSLLAESEEDQNEGREDGLV